MQLRFAIIAVAAIFCATSPALLGADTLPSIRFLLTFDDGPSGAIENNPTAKVIETLAANPVQSGIKALFFVQTRWPGAGGSAIGQRLLQQLVTEGHALGVHSGSARGHINHRAFHSEALVHSLRDGIADIKAVSGSASNLVRPPYWSFDARTLSAYDYADMAMLLTDLRVDDGAHWMFQAHPETGGRLYKDFEYFRERLVAGHIPIVDGAVPVVVTFHDPNPYTAEHLATYLSTLVRAAKEVGLPVADPPFYTDGAALIEAAYARATNRATRADLAP